MKDNLLPKCIVCGETPQEGMGDGLWIRRNFICRKCEEGIAASRVNDPGYDELCQCLKRLWA